MPFVVYEDDPLVRADICETLMAEFSGCGLAVAETIAGISELTASMGDQIIAVVSLSSHEIKEVMKMLSSDRRDIPVVAIISDLPDLENRELDWQYVQRPFGSGTLVAAVRNALSDLLQGRT